MDNSLLAALNRRVATPGPSDQAATPSNALDTSTQAEELSAFDRVIAARQQSVEQLEATRVEREAQVQASSADAQSLLDRQFEREEEQAGNLLGSLGTDSDAVRMLVGGAVAGSGTAFGKAPGYLLDQIGGNEDPTFGLGSVFTDIGNAVTNFGRETQSQISVEAEGDINRSQFTGNVLTGEDLSFGSDPNARGIGLQLLGVLGEFAPQAVGLLSTGAGGIALAAAVGGGQAGVAQGEEAEQYVMGLSEDELKDDSELYNDIRSQNPDITHEEAQRQVAASAKAISFGAGALIGGAGGAATNYILKGAQKKLAKSIAGRVTQSTVLSGAEEAAQEVGETVASRAATNALTGLDRSIGEDTFGDAVLGGALGSGLGTTGGLVSASGEAAAKSLVKRVENAQRTKQQNQTIADVVNAGDFDQIVDPNNRQQFPVEESVVALSTVAQSKTKSVEEKAQATEALGKIESQLSAEFEALSTDPSNPNTVFDKLVDEQQKIIDAVDERLKDGEAPELTALRNEAVSEIEALEKKRANPDAQQKEVLDRIKATADQLKQVSLARSNARNSNTEVSNTDLVQSVNEQSSPELISNTVEQVVERAALNPSAFSNEQLEGLSAYRSSLPEETQALLDQVTTQQLQEEPLRSTQSVQSDIFKGNPEQGFLGVDDYRSMVAAARESGDSEAESRALGMLSNFAANQSLKAQVLKEALVKTAEEGVDYNVLPNTTDPDKPRWSAVPNTGESKQSRRAVKQANGLVIHKGSGRLVRNVTAEAEFVGSALSLLQSLKSEPVNTNAREEVSNESTSSATASESNNASESQADPVETGTSDTNPSADTGTTDRGVQELTEPAIEPEGESGIDPDAVAQDPGSRPQAGLRDEAQASDTRVQLEAQAASMGLLQERSLNGEDVSLEFSIAQESILDTAENYLSDAKPGIAELFELLASSETGATVEQLVEWVNTYGSAPNKLLVNKFKDYHRIQGLTGVTLNTLTTTDNFGEYRTGGSYFNEQHSLGFNPFTGAKDANAVKEISNTIVHEMFHAISYHVITTKPELEAEIQTVMDEVEAWLAIEGNRETLTNPEQIEYAISNVHEFMANGMGTPALLLDFAKIPSNVGTNALSRLMNTLLNIINRFIPMTRPEQNVMQNVLFLTDKVIAANETPVAVSTDKQAFHFEANNPKSIDGPLNESEFFGLNKVAVYFTNTGSTPISQVPNFINGVIANAVSDISVLEPFINSKAAIKKFAAKGNPIPIFQSLVTHKKLWDSKIDHLHLQRPEGFHWQNAMDYFVGPDGKVDPAIKDAIIIAAHNFMLETGNSLWFNNEDGVRKILHLNDSDPISPEDLKTLSTVGRRQNGVINDLGAAIYAAAGLKAKSGTPVNEPEQVKGALGSMALALLLDEGYLQRDSVDTQIFNQEIAQLQARQDAGEILSKHSEKRLKKAKGEKHFFVRSNRDYDSRTKRHTDNAKLARFTELNRGSGTFLNDLFKTNFDVVRPTLKPIAFVQKFAKNTDRFIPKELAANLDKANRKPYRFHSELLSTETTEGGQRKGILHNLSRETLEGIAGVSNVDLKTLHVSNRDGVEAKNDGLRRQIDQVFEHLDDVLEGDVDTPFYIQNEAWKMFRVGQKSKTINPQGSKFHRALTAIGDARWDYEVDTQSGKNLDTFKYAIMESFDINTSGDPIRVLKQFDALLNEPTLVGPIETAIKLNQGTGYEPTLTEQQGLVDAANFGGENLHSFTALLALAKFKEAQRTRTPFTSNLMREGDGKNNGPVISLLTTGLSGDQIANKELMRLGGIFTKDDPYQTYDEYFEAGGKDMYQYVGDRALTRMSYELEAVLNGHLKDPATGKGREYLSTPQKIAALKAIVGDLRGPDEGGNESSVGDLNALLNPDTGLINSTLRKATKGPVTQIVFGAAAGKTVENMSDWFVEAFIGKFEKHLDEPEVLGPIVDAVNATMRPVDRIQKRKDNNYLSVEFTPEQRQAIREIMLHTYGVAVKETITSEFEGLLSTRKAMNEAGNMAFRAYDSVYQALRREAIAKNKQALNERSRLVSSKAVTAKIDDEVYTFDLSSEQEAEIREQLEFMFPGVATAFSDPDSANTNPDFPVGDGLSLIKNTKTGSNAGGYRSKPRFTGIHVAGFKGLATEAKIFTVNGLRKVLQGPGAGLSVLLTHSTDSSMANRTYSALDVLNNHDAVTGSAAEIKGAMQKLNGNFYNSVNDYSAPMEVGRMMVRVLAGYDSMIERFQKDEQFLEQMAMIAPPEVEYDQEGFKVETPSKLPPNAHVRNYLGILANAELNKRSFMKEITSIDQYQADAGHYTVSESQTLAAQERSTTPSDLYSEIVPEDLREYVNRKDVDTELEGATADVVDTRREPNRYDPTIPQGELTVQQAMDRQLSTAELNVLKKINNALSKTDSLEGALRSIYKSDNASSVAAIEHWTDQMNNHYDSILLNVGHNSLKNIRKWLDRREEAQNTPEYRGFAAPRSSVNPQIDYTTTQVFDALNGANPMSISKSRRLKTVLDQVVTKIHGAVGANEAMVKAQFGETVAELIAKSTLDGHLPFTSRAKVSGMKLSEAESFVLEQVELTVRASLTGTSTASKDVIKLFKKSQKALNPDGRDLYQGDWSKATQAEKDNAADIYQFIFKINSNTDINSTHLSRFVALSMVYDPLIKAMDFRVNTEQDFNKDTVNDVVDSLFRSALRFISDKTNKTFSNQKANERLQNLVTALVGHEHKKKLEMARKLEYVNEHLENATTQVSQAVRNTISKAGRSSFFQDRKSNVVKLIGTASADIADNRVDEVLDSLNKFRNDKIRNTRLGFVASIANEAVGQRAETELFFKLQDRVTAIEQERKHINESMSAEVITRFLDHDKISASEKAAITQIFIRNDLGALRGRFSDARIAELISDKSELKKEVEALVAVVENSHELGSDMVRDARYLGYHLATGNNTSHNLLLNAYNITNRFGTTEAGSVSFEQDHPLVSAVDALTSLMALEETSSSHLTFIKDVLATETARGNQSGLSYVMQMHQRLKQDAQETLFDGSPVQMLKGYSREIYNPNNTMVIDNLSNQAELEALGYQWVENLGVDAQDPDTKEARGIFVLEGVGLINRETGILSFTGSNARGSKINSSGTITDKAGTLINRRNRVAQVHLGKIQEGVALGITGDFNPHNGEKGRLVPVLDSVGNVVNYRYTMNHANKDSILDRDNDFSAILAGIASNQFDKVESKVHNRNVVQALRDFYEEDFATNQNAYLEVSKDSSDPLLREAYNLMPESTKRAMSEIWGENRMFIRNDVVDMITGYRNISVLDPFGKEEHVRSLTEDFFVKGLEKMFGKKAAIRVRQAEDMWLEGVKLLKDIVVIRNFWTLLGNVASNISLLVWYGVPIKDIAKGHQEALDGLVRYQDDLQLQAKLRNRVNQSGFDQDKLQDDLREVEVALKSNPVHTLIEEGMFQTIQEDINIAEEDPRYLNNFDAFIKAQTDKLPESVRRVGEIAVVARSTSLYKVLSKATQTSDFVGRYVLYQHLTTKRNPETHDSAISEIREAFVNYDTPTNRALQYSNITGLMIFTKYYIRVQKILAKLSRTNPIRGMGIALTDAYVRSLPTIIDSNALGSLGNNPLDVGALNLIGTYDDPIPLNLLFDLVN